jgi:2-hydroxychromene-2-carboxylate isomerase
MTRSIDYYFSLQSPWTYIGYLLFTELAKTHQLKVNYKPISLGNLFPETGGLPLSKRHPARQRYRIMELKRWSEKRGLKFHFQPQHWPFNSRLAEGMIIAAVEAGHDPALFIGHAHNGVWENQMDLADVATLIKLADEAGLPGAALAERSASDEIGAIYEQNGKDAISADVFGAPAWVLDGEVFWGQDRIELLADALKSGRKAYSGN